MGGLSLCSGHSRPKSRRRRRRNRYAWCGPIGRQSTGAGRRARLSGPPPPCRGACHSGLPDALDQQYARLARERPRYPCGLLRAQPVVRRERIRSRDYRRNAGPSDGGRDRALPRGRQAHREKPRRDHRRIVCAFGDGAAARRLHESDDSRESETCPLPKQP